MLISLSIVCIFCPVELTLVREEVIGAIEKNAPCPDFKLTL